MFIVRVQSPNEVILFSVRLTIAVPWFLLWRFSLKLMPAMVTSLSTWASIMQQTLMLSVYYDTSSWCSAFVLTGGQSLLALWHKNVRKSEWVWGGLQWYIRSLKSAICSIYESFHLGLSFRYHYLITILCHSYAKQKLSKPSEHFLSVWRYFGCSVWPSTNKRSASVAKKNSTWIM